MYINGCKPFVIKSVKNIFIPKKPIIIREDYTISPIFHPDCR